MMCPMEKEQRKRMCLTFSLQNIGSIEKFCKYFAMQQLELVWMRQRSNEFMLKIHIDYLRYIVPPSHFFDHEIILQIHSSNRLCWIFCCEISMSIIGILLSHSNLPISENERWINQLILYLCSELRWFVQSTSKFYTTNQYTWFAAFEFCFG